ncbi:phage tail tape measure protein, partial [Streptomyces sp. NPDC057927]
YLSSVKALTATTPQLKQRMAELDMEFKKLQADARTAGNETQTFGNQMVSAFSKFGMLAGISTATLFSGAISTAKDFMGIIIDIDTQMTNLQKVMSQDTDFAGVFERANESAKKYGQTLASTMDAVNSFAKMGYKENELGSMTDAAVVAGNVGDIETGKAADYLTASMIQWNKETSSAMGIIDSWNEISNNYAFW